LVFELLKATFTTALVLVYWDLELLLVLETNVLNHIIAVILFTYIKEDLHSIAFYSRTLNTTKLNYNVYNKELFVIYKAF